MKPLYLKIRNAKPYRELYRNLEQQGLIRVVGKNGAGKSTMWNLLAFLIYGTHPNKATKSNIQMDKKDYLIEYGFEKLGVRYVVADANKTKEKAPDGEQWANGYHLYKQLTDGSWKNVSEHKATDTRKVLLGILGWNQEEWFGYVCLSQQTTHLIINGTPGERQNYLSSIFNLNPLDTISEHYKVKAVELDQKVGEIERKIDEFGILQKMLEELPPEAELTESKQKAGDEEKTLQGQLEKLQQIQMRYQDMLGAFHGLESYKSQNPHLADVDPEALQSKLEALIKQEAEFNLLEKQIRDVCSSLIPLQQKLKSLPDTTLPEDYEAVMASPDISLEADEALLGRLKLERVRNPVLPPQPEALPLNAEEILQCGDLDPIQTQAEIQKIKNHPAPPTIPKPDETQMDELRYEVSTFRSQVSMLTDKLSQLEVEGNCPTCGSFLDPEHRAKHRQQTQENLEEMRQDLQIVQEKLLQQQESQRVWFQYEAAGPDRAAELPRLIEALRRYEQKIEVRNLIEKHEAWNKKFEAFQETEQIPEIEQRINLYRKKLEYRTLKDRLQEAQQTRLQLEGLEKTYQNLMLEKESFKNPAEELKGVKASLTGLEQLRKLTDLYASFDKTLTDQQQNMQTVSEHLTQLRQVISGCTEKLKRRMELSSQLQELSLKISEGDELIRQKKKAEILAKGYGKSGKIRQYLLAKFSKYLEEALTCHTYRQLPNHRLQISAEDGIHILTSKDGGEPYDVKFMSGGEKGALSVAFMFALDDMQAPEKRTGLKVIDEAESAFDAERKFDFIDYTLNELRKRAETVIVISHTPVEDETSFDKVWEVRDGTVHDVVKETREFI